MEDNMQPIFVIDPEPVAWPVVVEGVPVAGGNFGRFQFTALICVLAESEYAQILGDAKLPADAPMPALLEENARLLPQLVAGWERVKDKDGTEVPFSPEALAKQLTGRLGRQLGAGLWRAVSEVRFGVRLGNFAPPPDAGSPSAAPAAPTNSTPT